MMMTHRTRKQMLLADLEDNDTKDITTDVTDKETMSSVVILPIPRGVY